MNASTPLPAYPTPVRPQLPRVKQPKLYNALYDVGASSFNEGFSVEIDVNEIELNNLIRKVELERM